MDHDENLLTINILNRNFQVKCDPQKQSQLLQAANYLREKAEYIKQTGKLVDFDRILVMAALTISHEFIEQKENPQSNDQITLQLNQLKRQIREALNES